MLLAIDVGNTHITYGLHDGGEWRHTWRQHTDTQLTEDEIIAFVTTMLAQAAPGTKITRVGVCSVVPAIDERLKQFSERSLSLEPVFVTYAAAGDLPIRVDPPQSLGADRVANAVAAIKTYGCPCIVVDMGTATTFDAISRDGEYLGGAIMPGVEISATALFHRAAKLNKVPFVAPPTAIGRSTDESLRSGIVRGFAAAIDGLVEQIAAELGEGTTVVATGGVAESIVAACRTVQHVDRMLTLEGVRLLVATG